MKYQVSFRGISEKMSKAVHELAREIDLEISEKGITVNVKQADKLTLSYIEGRVELTYGNEHEFYRAVSYLPRIIANGGNIDEKAKFNMLCFMGDMSRNAVYNIPTAKQMIRYLALMGYDSLMLYNEDVYEVPQYPYFGYMRGRFTGEELKEIDDYADMFGIEVIPCIQTLAHLATAIRWPGLASFKDTEAILLVGDEKTYTFVDTILKASAKYFRSRRINLGMDEAHALGLGRYLSINGYKPAPEIMLEHLDRVVKICEENGYSPMIWSDMFFRMVFGGTYRVKEGELPPEVMARVPKNLTLIYWDYYSLDKQIFSHMIDCHLKCDNPVVFAGGAWKWSGFAPHNKFSLASTELQLDVCADRGVDNIIVTSWGDDGSETAQFSVLSSMIYFAERGYCNVAVNEAHLEARCNECFGIGFEALVTLDAPNEVDDITVSQAKHPLNPSKYLLYNDPLEGLFDKQMNSDRVAADYKNNAQRLKKYIGHPKFGYMFDMLYKLCVVLENKSDLGIHIRDAYKNGRKSELADIAENTIPTILSDLDDFIEAFRKQWYIENKTFGFSVQEIRLGALKERLKSVALRLADYADGKIDRIEELEQEVLGFTSLNPKEGAIPYINMNRWQQMVTAGVLSF